MKVIFKVNIIRAYLREHPDWIFLFGDNIEEKGLGGQAGEMRGEPNAVGIPTKWKPTMRSDAFFSDDDFSIVKPAIDAAFHLAAVKACQRAGVIVVPPLIGTGRAKLDKVAPLIFDYMWDKICGLCE